MYGEVLVEYGVKTLDKTFTYIIPNHLKDKIQIGMKVIVPFGTLNINGFLINIKDSTEIEELKEIISISNEEFILNEELLKLGKYIKEKTLCTLITAYNTMFPSSLKIKTISSNYNIYDTFLKIKDKEKVKMYINEHKRAFKKIELLNKLINNEKVNKKEYNSSLVKELLDLNLIYEEKISKYRINKEKEFEEKVTLTKEQEEVIKKFEFNKSKTHLLYGVTGSGKTEVYMHLIEKVIKTNKTAIILVPEISLTTQIVNRFYKRFGNNVAVFHSGLSKGERHDEYKKIYSGDVKIVVGTRSAIFTPMKNIGIIIIDEEHSTSYKQDNNPRYNAIDIAIKRSEYHNCPLLLGSATPTLEAFARGLKGVYKLLVMTKRATNAPLPKIHIIDMKAEAKKSNMIISDALNKLIIEKLNKKEQIMLFLNKRGFDRIINCRSCGFTFKCKNCEISMIYHKTSNNLRCHYCGYTLLKPEVCPECREDALSFYGLGTEKLEEHIKETYKDARVIRMDTDTTTRKDSYEKIITKVENEEVDIIIGTQMISKGLDFPKVTLVGVINADESLNIPDFRSGENTFSLLAQVSGRSGRSDIPGEVVIQTFNPDNDTINFVKENNYQKLFNYEMHIRRILKYPPYFYLTSILVTSRDYEKASTEVNKVSNYLNKNIKDTIVLGPTTASMFKINNVYRFQIILKYKDFNNIKEPLKYIDNIYSLNKDVSLEIDVDPKRI
ncbi:MAG TPA: primosomal protein N' [Mollicutes bacterium]|nr:primosomal protein N' [Mollicutes bacterium]